jgi:hypothetical protein
LNFGGEAHRLDVSTGEEGGALYYVVSIQRDCFERVAASVKDVSISSAELDVERTTFFPDNSDSSATKSRVVIVNAGDGEILEDEIVDFRPRMYLRAKLPDIIGKVSGMVRAVFDGNPAVSEVFVMVDVNGEPLEKPFEGVVANEETGDF